MDFSAASGQIMWPGRTPDLVMRVMDRIFAERRRLAIAALLAAIVVLAVVRSAAGTRLDGFTVDEPWHAVAGASYSQHGDFALNPEHPPLVKRWVGWVLGAGFVVPPTPPLADKQAERAFVESTMHALNDDAAAQSRIRLAMWALHGMLLFAVAVLVWRAFGAAWAVGSTAFLAIEPSVGAYFPVVMTDLAVALTLLIAALALGLVLHGWRWGAVAVLGIGLGLALGAKHSALPGLAGLAACAVIGWAWQARRSSRGENLHRLGKLGVAGLLAVVVLWAQYDFGYAPRPDGSDGFNRDLTAKIGDLHRPVLRGTLQVAVDLHLLPRAYVWGLADTLRAGIEGRGDAGTLLWGTFVPGSPPWYAWPSFIVTKMPLALLAAALLGLAALWRAPLSPRMRWTLAAVAAMAVGHAFALGASNSAFAGFRHATPVAFALAIPAGALVWRAWLARRRAWRLVPIGLVVITLAMTLGEPRLWEYHNELVGGSAGAQQYFDHESVEVGQRLRETREFYDREIAPHGGTLYIDHATYGARDYFAAHRLAMQPRVDSIHDDNRAGVFEGWFLKNTRARIPAPQWGYDPERALGGLEPVARFGNVEIWRGRQERPGSRAWPLLFAIFRYVYSENGDDWALVADRAQQVLEMRPQLWPAAIELGNARVKLGDRDGARAAYAAALQETAIPVPEEERARLQAQIAMLDEDLPLDAVAPLRSPWLE
jgi:hypothetical protein